jgi:hypothetical protein
MLARLTQLSLEDLLLSVVAPLLLLLQILMVPFYIIWTMRIWPQMPRREAVFYAPLGIPLGFICFFFALELLAGDQAPTRFIGILALVTLVTWLPGIPVAVFTYRWRKSSKRG